MTLEELRKHLGKFDGYAVGTLSDTLADRTDKLEDCIQNAICLSEADCYDDEYRAIDIWSVEQVTVKGIAPCGETVIDHMWENFHAFEDFMTDVTKSQKETLGEMIAETISSWIKKEEIHFDYYNGIKSKTLSYKELLILEKEIEKKESVA